MPEYRVAIAGLGTIGLKVARTIDCGDLPGLTLTAVSARDHTKAAVNLKDFRTLPAIVQLNQLADFADVIVECSPAAVFGESAQAAIARGLVFITVSAGALLERADLIELAKNTGAQIIIPTGALIGLDAVRAAAEGEISKVTHRIRKPGASLKKAPFIMQNDISLDNLDAPLCVFKGTARQAAQGFPANVNVSAALGLAGIGADKTIVEIWADPTIDRNIHEVSVEADSARFSMKIENIPSQNAATGKITALSVIAALRRLTAPLVIGS
jgi:aspartate dehydrogenase